MKGAVAAMSAPETVRVEHYDVPSPEPGALLLKIRRANVCGSELHIFHGHHPLIRQGVLGHEFVGEIAGLGAGVETDYAGQPVSVGDRTVAAYYLTCMRCAACVRGDFNLCRNAYGFWSKAAKEPPHFHGGFATHYYVHPHQYFYKVPDGVPDEVVAGANCALSQVLYGLHLARLEPGNTVVVQGAGGLGLNAAAVASEIGARVVVVEGIAERIELARQFGADEVVDLRELGEAADRVERVSSLTNGYGADVVLEVTGVPAAFTEALELVRPSGTVVEIGNVNVGPDFEVPMAPGLITRKGIRVIGVVRYQPWFLHRALKFLERNHARYPYATLTDREYGLDEVAAALEQSERRSVARPVVVPV
ncbi:MAG: zinc-binding dehydrogenase [Egibacteraceae bacterium]